MNPNTQTRVTPFAAILFRLLNKIELIALVAAVVGLAMLYSSIAGAPEILMVSLSVLASVFFLRGYVPPPVPEQKDNELKSGFFELLGGTILPKVGWIGCSVTTIGILFHLLSLKGNEEMLMIGCTALTAALILAGTFIVSRPERSAGLMQLAYRAMPVLVVGVYLFLSSPKS